MKQLFALALCGLLIAGCSSTKKAEESTGGATSGSSSAGKSENSLAGTYKAGVVVETSADGKEDPEKKMAAEMARMMTDTMSLEMRADGTFTLTTLMLPIEGKWKQSGETVEFTPVTIMGMSPEDLQAKAKAEGKTDLATDDMAKPFTMSVAGGKLVRKGDKPNDPTMEFTKEPARVIGESKVEGKEAELVGKFGGQIEPLPGKTLTKDDESQLEFMKSMKIDLELFQDKTFTLVLGARLEGDWKLEGEKLTLTPTKLMGQPVDGKENKADPIVCTIQADGSMTAPAPDGGPVQLVFKK